MAPKGAVQYLDEWAQYHLLAMGFDDIYLYDGAEDLELQAWHRSYNPNLRERIHIQHLPDTKRGMMQSIVFATSCAKKVYSAHVHSWVAFLKIDDFLVLRNHQRYPYISDFLESLPVDHRGVAVNLVIFRWNQQMHHQNLPVTLRFQNRSEAATKEYIHTILRPQYALEEFSAPTLGYLLFRVFFRWGVHSTYDTRGNLVDGPVNPALDDEEVAIYHYHTRSLEEYKERCLGGRRATVSGNQMSLEPPILSCRLDIDISKRLSAFPEQVKDDAPWQLLKDRVPNYTEKYEA